VPEMPEDLRTALSSALMSAQVDALGRTVNRLIETYRSGVAPTSPILASPLDAAAYAAYRMPATYAAVSVTLRELGRAAPDFAPQRLLDLGGGTGAAAWAAADRFPSLRSVIVADQASDALAQGRELARFSHSIAVREARWLRWTALGADLPNADLVTISYVLGELSAADQTALIRQAARLGNVVVVVEPGTPAGYDRVLAARSMLIDAGWRVVAPCPHADKCPLVAPDWCHFAVRVNRSAIHRRVKSAELGYEDEKFSYVIAESSARPNAGPPPARVLRRPAQRKGLVSLRLCRPDGTASDEIITRRLGSDVYRAARDVEWGDPWVSPDVS
jgi:ribosomal protein RSM22 (predicted rRNA methylase)